MIYDLRMKTTNDVSDFAKVQNVVTLTGGDLHRVIHSAFAGAGFFVLLTVIKQIISGMELNTDEKKRVIKLFGRLDGNTSRDLDQVLITLTGEARDIILDLSECSYLSSAGIRVLLSAQKRLQPNQFQLFIVGASLEVQHIFEMAGLQRILPMASDVESALAVIHAAKKGANEETAIPVDQLIFVYRTNGGHSVKAEINTEAEILSCCDLEGALGYGAVSDGSGFPGDDFFVTIGPCTGFIPADPASDPDFRIIADPVKTGFPVRYALSFGNTPSGTLRMATEGVVNLRQLTRALQTIRDKNMLPGNIFYLVAVSHHAEHPSLNVLLMATDAEVNTAAGNCFNVSDWFWGRQDAEKQAGGNPIGGSDGSVIEPGYRFAGITFQLVKVDKITETTLLSEFIDRHLTFENITAVVPAEAGLLIENPFIWLFSPETIAEGAGKRVIIETAPGMMLEPNKKFLARLLYTDSSRLVLNPLHGGYSAQTYHVTSYDHEGRKMRPTVLKVASRALITRESERCQKYALPYIFNNCAVVLGTERFGDSMALRYNFVGIGGEASQLKWLTHYYHDSDLDFLEPLFDKIFLQILKPWYGQPVKKTIFPFKDHDPTRTFFPHIYKTAEEILGISDEMQYLKISESGRPILNPYWFLKREYERNREWSLDYNTGICHGDLNMQNILLDENRNVYLIDFSETRPRSVVSDFARLEAIFLVDNAPIENESDMKSYLEFIRRFYECKNLGDRPEIIYAGKHPEKVAKNAGLTIKMREYAFTSAEGDQNSVPYYVALLEWVLPMVCYTSLPYPLKRLSMIVSSLLCEKVNTHLLTQL